MAQFDVHLNKGQLQASIPFVVLVQSSLYDRYKRRVVVPLVLRQGLRSRSSAVATRMNPVFQVGGLDVVLNPLEIVSLSLDQLGLHVGSLADQGGAIADALDELFSRSWG